MKRAGKIKTNLIQKNHIVLKKISFKKIAEMIRKGSEKDLIGAYRNGDSNAKNKLHGFTPSAQFGEKRKEEHFQKYLPFVQIDIDKIPTKEIKKIQKTLPHCHMAVSCLMGFVSPSGNGYKMIIRINSNKEDHEATFNTICDEVDRLFKLTCDRKIKSVMTQCYISYDTNIYYNADAIPFTLFEDKSLEYKNEIDAAIRLANKKFEFTEGERNNFIHHSGCILNKFGVPMHIAIKNLNAQYRFDEDNNEELIKAIKSAYTNNPEEHGIWNATVNNSRNYQFEKGIFKNLPPKLFELCDFFEDKFQKDVFLLSALTSISGCLPMVKGHYSHATIYPPIYTYIIAPPASGKGVMSFGKRIAEPLNYSLYKMADENNDIKDYGKKTESRRIILSGNSSTSALIEDFAKNKGVGILMESEADFIGQNAGQDWGNNSPIFRGAYHHEMISFSRRTNKEKIQIDNPKLAICLTSTIDQLSGITKSVDDGLFSRFIFYNFEPKIEWKSPRPKSTDEINTRNIKLQDFGEDIVKFYKKNVDEDGEIKNYIQFKYSEKQWNKFDDFFGTKLDNAEHYGNENLIPSIKRMGLIVYRLSMVLTSIRSLEIKTKTLKCSDIDFDIAIYLGEILLNHTELIIESLPKQTNKFHNDNRDRVFDSLGDSFRAKEYINLAQKIGVSERTAYRMLKNDSRLKKNGSIYQKK